MDPEHHNLNTKSVQKEQNYSFTPKVPQESMLKILDLEWRKRLEQLFNDTDDQDDYFQVYSEASNTSISTICINSNESRHNDSFWSDTDVTRRDDIVIQLSESAFYNTKVNPFPQLKFPPSSSTERNESKMDKCDRNNEDLATTDVEDSQTLDVVITEVEDENSNVEIETLPKIGSTNAGDKDLAPTESALDTIQNTEDLTPIVNIADVPKDENIVEDNQNGNNVATVDNDKNDTVDDKSQDVDNLPSNFSVSENHSRVEIPTENVSPQQTTIPEVTTDVESTSISRKNSGTSRKSSVHRSTMGESSISTTNGIMKKPEEQRKKCYKTRNRSMAVETNHRRNVKRLPSQLSGCTEVTSTTTVHVSTNDDAVFDALADMPDFINSSVIDLASSYVDDTLKKNQQTRFLDFDSDFLSSVSSNTPSWRNERISSVYDDYLSPTEAYKQLNTLLTDGTKENLKAVAYDDYNDIRFDDEIPSSEDEFMSDDDDDLDVTNQNWIPPESELRRQVTKILRKLHPLENDYGTIINDMLCKYVSYIDSKQRIAKVNRIVEIVDMPITQQQKTELLIQREINDKKLNREFYYSQFEPPDFTELGERRRDAIVKKYAKCHNDRLFCHNYFNRSIDDRPVSKLGWRLAKLKKEMGLIFA